MNWKKITLVSTPHLMLYLSYHTTICICWYSQEYKYAIILFDIKQTLWCKMHFKIPKNSF